MEFPPAVRLTVASCFRWEFEPPTPLRRREGRATKYIKAVPDARAANDVANDAMTAFRVVTAAARDAMVATAAVAATNTRAGGHPHLPPGYCKRRRIRCSGYSLPQRLSRNDGQRNNS